LARIVAGFAIAIEITVQVACFNTVTKPVVNTFLILTAFKASPLGDRGGSTIRCCSGASVLRIATGAIVTLDTLAAIIVRAVVTFQAGDTALECLAAVRLRACGAWGRAIGTARVKARFKPIAVDAIIALVVCSTFSAHLAVFKAIGDVTRVAGAHAIAIDAFFFAVTKDRINAMCIIFTCITPLHRRIAKGITPSAGRTTQALSITTVWNAGGAIVGHFAIVTDFAFLA